jgi:hypothetical protein
VRHSAHRADAQGRFAPIQMPVLPAAGFHVILSSQLIYAEGNGRSFFKLLQASTSFSKFFNYVYEVMYNCFY